MSNKVDSTSSTIYSSWNKASKVSPVDGEAATYKGIEEAPSQLSPDVKAVEKGSSGLFEFSDSDAIKKKVREAKAKKEKYNVHNEYHETGFAQSIAKNAMFENIVLGVIVLNVIWIGIDTDWNTPQDSSISADEMTLIDFHPVFIAADSLFFGFFVAELVIRFLAFKRKIRCFQDGWFVFDSTLVALYAFDPFLLALISAAAGGGSSGASFASLVRLLRLARLSRLVRMFRYFPELMIMIKGILTAVSTVSYTLALLLVITYIFAIALTQLSDGKDFEFHDTFFSGVALSMYSLIIYGTFLDNLAYFCDKIREESTVCLMVVTVFVILASLTVMNMLIGVLCEVINAVAEEERESIITDQVYDKFRHIVKMIDENNNGKLSWKEFQGIMSHNEAIEQLESVGVDPLGMIDFAQDAFQKDGQEVEIEFSEFMTLVMELRGSQMATLKDLMTMQKHVNSKFSSLTKRLEAVDKALDDVLGCE